jgi:Protein of unknown function, DUF481
MFCPQHRKSPSWCVLALLAGSVLSAPGAAGQAASTKPASPPPDVLVLKNGDTLHGKLVSAMAGKVTFNSDPLGDLSIPWDNIRELHTNGPYAVLATTLKMSRKQALRVPTGKIEAANDMVTVAPANQAALAPIPTQNAQFIIDAATLDQQVNHEPSFLRAWNGTATAGATLVKATENQYTVSGALNLLRTVPAVPWLDTRNRTEFNFSGSYGKITQPAYFSAGVSVPASSTKTAILHADGERDEYLSAKFFALGQVAFDHNYSQDLNLQQIYGGGIGWTAVKDPKQEVDLKATMQYEKQSFIAETGNQNQNLIGSTFAVQYDLKTRMGAFTQTLAFIPAYNNSKAYSANETDTFTFPVWKHLGFSVGTLDSYLNFVPATLPPTKRNSFQFTMGLTYAIQSKY